MGLWCWWGGRQGVEVASTIAMKRHAFGQKILHRKTQSVKFNGTIIFPSKPVNGKKVANKGWDN